MPFSLLFFYADVIQELASDPSVEQKPQDKRQHGKNKPKYKSAMKVKITDRVRKKREAKALKEKQNKVLQETLSAQQVEKSATEKQSKDIQEIVKEPVQEVIYKDKYDIIKERRARMSRASQEQRSLSPNKTAKESVQSSPKKQSRQRHTSSGSQKSEASVSVLRNSESEEEGALKQQALEALLEITGKEFKSMSSYGVDKHTVSTLGDAVVAPHTPPSLLKKKSGPLKREVQESPLMQFAKSAQLHEQESLKPTPDSESKTHSETQKELQQEQLSGKSTEADSQLNQKQGKHVCNYCGRRCSKPSVLKKHIRSHTGERPYPCVPCGISFKTKSNLYKHCKSHAHAAKAGTSGTDLKPSDFENESCTDETDTDGEGEKDPLEEGKEIKAEPPANNQPSMLLATQHERLKMTQTSMQTFVNGGHTSVPDSHPTFVPSSKSQASPVASQTGSAVWGALANSGHHTSSRSLHEINRSLQQPIDVLSEDKQRTHRESSYHASTSQYENRIATPPTYEGRGDVNYAESASHATPSLAGEQTAQRPSQSQGHNSSSQIMIPLTNFNIVKSGGQYHFQIPVEGIPGLSEDVIKQQGLLIDEERQPAKERVEKSRPTLNSPSTNVKLQQHIQKLITQNQAIVDDTELESVKPRRPSFSYRESLTSITPQPSASNPDVHSESKIASESSAVSMETRRRSELAEQTNLDSKQEVRGNHDRQREAQTHKSSQNMAHLHAGQPRHELPYKAAEASISAGPKLPTSLPVTLHQAVPGDSSTIRNILLQHKLTQQAPSSMLGQSLPMDRQQYSPLWAPSPMMAPWMLKEVLQGGLRYPVPAMYHHPAMMQHLPTDPSQAHQYLRENAPNSQHHSDIGKTAHKRKKSKSESDSSGSHDPHHSRKRMKKHNDRMPIQEEEAMKGLQNPNAAHSHSTLPMFSPPYPGPDANQAASQLLWMHASLPKGTSTPLRSPYSPKPSMKAPEASFPGVSVIQHTPTTPHAPSQFPVLPPQTSSSLGQEFSDRRRDSPAGGHHFPRESKSPGSAFHSTGSGRGEFPFGNPVLHSPGHDGLLKVVPPQSPLTPKTQSIASPMIPGPPTNKSKDEQQRHTPSMEQMPVNEALARKKRSFTLALDENSARASLQKRRNLPAIPGLNMSPGRSIPTKRTPSDQSHALDLTSKMQSMGSPMSAKIPKVEMSGRSPAYTPTEGGKKFLKSPMKSGAGAAARHRLSLDLQHPLTAAVKGVSTPDGPKPSPKIDPRVLLSPEALSIAESVMKMSNSPLKAKTPSTPIDAARELGRLVAHAFHNAGGSISSVLTTSDEGVIVGPIATPTAEGKPMSKYFILPSPSSSHAPSFPSSSSPRSEKSPLTPSDSEMKSPIQARPPSVKKDTSGSSGAFEFAKAGEQVKVDGKDKNQNENNVDKQSPVMSKPKVEESSGDDFTVDDQIVKVLAPVLQEKSLKTMPKKQEKTLADWFASVKTNKAGNGPSQAPTFLYANISSRMKGVAQVTYCCSRRVQPMYVLQNSNHKISMYSNWKPGGNTKHPLGISWRAHLGLYNSSMNKENIKDVVSSISPTAAGILTHSSAWNMTAEKIMAVSEEMQKQPASKTAGLSPAGTPTDSEIPSSLQESESQDEKSVKGKEPKRIPIFEGGFKSNEDYVYVRGRGRGKYVCQECGIRCKKPSMLKKHIRTHTDVRPFQCSVCSFAFKTKGNLTKHMKSKAHTKKCLENGINPSDLEQEHGIDSSAYEEDDDHQYSDADDNEDTDSADEDSEEEEMDDGMDEEMEIDDPPQNIPGEQDSQSISQGESIRHPAKLKRSYSEILKPPNADDMRDDSLHGSKPTRSEVVCKLSQHLSNRQRAHVGQDRTHPPLTKSHSLSHLPTLNEGFSRSISRQKSQPPPVLDKYGHIVSLQSYVPCTSQYRLATGNSVPSSAAPHGNEKPLSEETNKYKDALMSSSSGAFPESGSRTDAENEKSSLKVFQAKNNISQSDTSSMTPIDSLSKIRPNRVEDSGNTSSTSREFSEKSALHLSSSIGFRPHESLMRMRERSDSGMRFYTPGSDECLPPKVSPMIEPVSEDEDDSESKKSKLSLSSTATAPKSGSSPASTEAAGNAIKQLLLAKPSLWPSPGDKSPLQPYVSPFLPPSPSLHTAPIPSPTHLSPFSPGPFTRLVSPMLPSKMFQLPPTILPMHLPPTFGPSKSTSQPEKEKDVSPSEGDHAEASPMVSPSESHPKEKSPSESAVDESRPSGSEEERLAMSPTGNHGHHRCSQCGETFIKPSQLRIHARVHTSDGSFTCHDCLVSFPTKYLLSKHERSEEHFLRVEGVELATTTGSDTNPRPFKCKECAIAFRIPGHLAKHLRSKGHLMTLERQGKLPAHKLDLLHMHPDVEEGAGGTGEQKAPCSPASSEKTDSASEAEEGKS